MRTFVARLLCLGLLAAQLASLALAAGTEGTIYDSRILARMKLEGVVLSSSLMVSSLLRCRPEIFPYTRGNSGASSPGGAWD